LKFEVWGLKLPDYNNGGNQTSNIKPEFGKQLKLFISELALFPGSEI
jgi:hypothetical protein